MKNYEDKIYSLGETVTRQTQAMSQAVQKTLENNGGVGIMTGSYDQNGFCHFPRMLMAFFNNIKCILLFLQKTAL